MLRVETLGRLTAVTAAGTSVSAPKRLALLAILASAGDRGVSRDKIIAYLWPESSAPKAYHALEQLLYALRRETGEQLFVGAGPLRLDQQVVSSDVGDFERALQEGDLEKAIASYGGPFLDGFFVPDALEFERWMDGERSRLVRRYAEALEQLATRASAAADGHAVVWWRRLAELDPYDSRIARGLMQALAAAGNPAGAIRHAEAHESLLREELGASPDPSLAALSEQLRTPHPLAPALAAVLPPQTSPNEHDRPAPEPFASSAPPSRLVSHRVVRVGAIGITSLALVAAAQVTLRALGVSGAGDSTRATPIHRERERILVADFEVSGVDSSLARVVTEAVRTDLDRSKVVAVMPPAAVEGVLQRMRLPPTTPIALPLAREIAARQGIKAIVEGDVAPLGSGLIITVRLRTADSGNTLALLSETADSPRELIPTVGKLTRQLRGSIGESLTSVRADPPLEQVTTSSLDALRKYVAGSEAHRRGELTKSVALLEEAIALDTAFAMAHRKLAMALGNSQMGFARWAAALTNTYRFRDRLTDRERSLTIADYHRIVTRDRGSAVAANEGLLDKYPDESNAAANLSGLLIARREFGRAESLLRGSIQAGRDGEVFYGHLMQAQVSQGKLDAADSSLVLARERIRTPETFAIAEVWILVNRGRLDSAAAVARRSLHAQEPVVRVRALNSLAFLALLRGRLSEWNHIRAELAATNAARGNDQPVESALPEISMEIWLRDRPSRALAQLDAMSRRVSDSVARMGVDHLFLQTARLYALAGRPDRARSQLARFDAAVDSIGRRIWTASRHETLAEIALADNQPTDAIREFRLADNAPDGPATDCVICLPARLGRAFDQAGMADSAIAMFERYIATPYYGRLRHDAWYLPRIYERLGLLYDLRGDSRRAASYYAKFIDLWEDADPSLRPRVQEVRRRLARTGR